MTPPALHSAVIDTQALFHDYLLPWSTKIALAALVFAVGSIIATWIARLAGRAMGRTRLDPILTRFAGSAILWLLLLIVLMAALDQLGVNTTSLIALLGAAGLAVGLALKDTMQNFAAGVMLILFRPFKSGDFINAGGSEGVVEEIRFFNTLLRSPDNRDLTVPNGDIFNGTIVNNSARSTRRIDLVVGIGYGDDLRRAKEILAGVLADEPRILAEPEPFIAVGELGESSVDLLVRPWVAAADFFAVKCDLTERIKLAFDEAGISIPYPQMDVHLDRSE